MRRVLPKERVSALQQRDAPKARWVARVRSIFLWGVSFGLAPMAIATEQYALEWRTPGLARYTNASDMSCRVSGQHWFVSVARPFLRADGAHFIVSYAQLNIVLWIAGDFGDGSLVDGKYIEMGVEKVFVEELVQSCLAAGTIPMI